MNKYFFFHHTVIILNLMTVLVSDLNIMDSKKKHLDQSKLTYLLNIKLIKLKIKTINLKKNRII